MNARPSTETPRLRIAPVRWCKSAFAEKLGRELGPAGLPRAAPAHFPYRHRTLAEIYEDANRRAILRDLGRP